MFTISIALNEQCEPKIAVNGPIDDLALDVLNEVFNIFRFSFNAQALPPETYNKNRFDTEPDKAANVREKTKQKTTPDNS